MAQQEQAEEDRILEPLAVRLHEIFDPYIDVSDVQNVDQRESHFRTRAYAALSLMNEASISPEIAANAVCDGGLDDGIDAIYVDAAGSKVYFGQSKWKANTNKGVDLSEFVRFRDGVKNVIALKWYDQNANLHRFRQQIETQFSNIDTEVVLLFSHTSAQKLSDILIERVTEFLADQNRLNPEFISFREFTLPSAAKTARSFTRPTNISLSVLLGHWGVVTDPYSAVYGSVAATDLAQWYEDNGVKLFAENLRYAIEKSDVNDGIVDTAVNSPEKFWYFNNGVTAICEKYMKQPHGGTNTASGLFDLTRVSIINGAQTISSLHKAWKAGAELAQARVHFRAISLQQTPENFAINVTNANNTQNNLSSVDFAAADTNQERIRKEAALLGITYSYRRGEKDPERNLGFTIRSATVASACASGDLKLAVSAKRYISGLWEDTTKEPYTRIFNSQVTAAFLWRVVRVMNIVDDELAAISANLAGRERLTTVHGNRFVLFYVYKMMGDAVVRGSDDIAAHYELARQLTARCVTSLLPAIEAKFPDAYPGNIFKNQDRQVELLKVIEATA